MRFLPKSASQAQVVHDVYGLRQVYRFHVSASAAGRAECGAAPPCVKTLRAATRPTFGRVLTRGALRPSGQVMRTGRGLPARARGPAA